MSCHGVSLSQELVNIEPITKSPGIYLSPSGSIKLVSDYLHIIIPVEINYIRSHIDNIKDVLHSAQYLCAKSDAIDDFECQNAFLPLVSIYDDILRDYNAISHLTSNKSKRSAWISGIGTLLKQIIGTMDEDDAIRYNDAIQTLKMNNVKLLDLVKDNILISKTAILSFNETLIQINKNERQLNIMIENLSSCINNLTINTNSLLFKSVINDMFSALQSSMLSISYKIEDIVNAILFAKSNTLHPSIATPRDLYQDLVNNVKHLPKHSELAVSLELDNIHTLISISDIVTYVLDNKLVFTIKIPLVFMTLFNLYKTIPIPVPHNVTTYGSFALIIPTSSYVAINQEKSRYITLNDLSNCKAVINDIYICNQLNEFDVHDYPICETEIISKVLTSLPKQCKTNFLYGNTHIWQSLSDNRWVFTHSEPTKLNVECRNEISEHTVYGTGILTLRANCTAYCKNVKLVGKRHPTYKFSHIHSDFNLINDSCCNLIKFKKLNYSQPIIKLPNFDIGNLNHINDKTNDLLEMIQKLKIDNESIPVLTSHSIISYVFVFLFVLFTLYYFCNRKCVAYYRKFKPSPVVPSVDNPVNNNRIRENIQMENLEPRIRIH